MERRISATILSGLWFLLRISEKAEIGGLQLVPKTEVIFYLANSIKPIV